MHVCDGVCLYAYVLLCLSRICVVCMLCVIVCSLVCVICEFVLCVCDLSVCVCVCACV